MENKFNLDKKLYLFYGENLGQKNDFKKKIKELFSGSDIILISQDELIKDNDLLYKEIVNISLFEKNKIILINQASDKIYHLIESIIEKVDEQKIFLFADILDKKSKIRNLFESSNLCAAVACYQDNEVDLRKIVNNTLKGYEGVTSINTNLILNTVLLDRSKLKNELEKIKIFFKSKKIETEKLEELLNIRENDDFNKLKDQAFSGNNKNTNKLLSETVLDAEKIILYLNIINQRISRILEILKNSKSNNIEKTINELKPPIFWKDKPNLLLQTKKWSIEKIKNIQNESYNLEVKIKSNSVVNKNLLIKKLLVDICKQANV